MAAKSGWSFQALRVFVVLLSAAVAGVLGVGIAKGRALRSSARSSAQAESTKAGPPNAQALQATGTVSRSRIAQPINERVRVTLHSNVHPLARAEYDRGAVADSLPAERMLLILQRSPEREAACWQASSVNVTEVLRSKTHDGQLSFVVANSAMGGDPAVGADKVLVVIYRYQGSEAAAIVRDGYTLTLP
jgi:hypothetical protein